MMRLRGVSVGGTAYVSAVIVAGIATVPFGLLAVPVDVKSVPILIYLAIFTQIAALLPIQWKYGVQSLHTLPLVAVALLAPGAVGLIAWLCLYDGRRPSADLPLWRLINARATVALGMAIPAVLAAQIPLAPDVAVPLRTAVIAAGLFVITNLVTAGAFAFLLREPYWRVLSTNVGLDTARMLAITAFGGGVLFVILKFPAGYLLGAGLIAMILAVRSNMTDALRQQVERVQTLELLAQALDARDPLTELHSQRVSELAARLGEILELSPLEVERLRVAGLLHDIGKIGVPDSILKKPGRLDPDEWLEMRSHAARGADMIARHSALEPLESWVRHHHERMDGTGYPSSKVGDEIPLGSRILAVADSYDTITGPRIYRQATLTPREAVLDISRRAGEWYDPVVVDALRSLHSLPSLHHRRPLPDFQASEVAGGWRLLRLRRRFAAFAGGMAISSLGDPLTTVAVVVTVYALTKNPFAVGAIYALKGIVTVLSGSVFGGIVDGWDRRRVIVGSDLIRALVLVSVPVAVGYALWTVFLAVVVLAAADALGQSARDASLPELVGKGEVSSANALIGTLVLIAGAAGYPLAAGLLLKSNSSTTPLFLVDALTFGAAGLLSLGIGRVGGRVAGRRMTGAFRAAWMVPHARGPLMVAGTTALFASMMFPTVVILAYQFSTNGAGAFTLLELLITLGMISGTVLLSWRPGRSHSRLTVIGLLVMGGFSLGVALSPWLPATAAFLFVASAGNMVYAIGNRSTLQEAALSDHRGSVMVVRFVITQSMVVLGSSLGGVIAARTGAQAVYGVIGVGILGLATLVLGRARTGRVPSSVLRADEEHGSATPAFSPMPQEYAERA